MWDLPRPGLEPVSPALAGRFSTTVPPGKPWTFLEVPSLLPHEKISIDTKINDPSLFSRDSESDDCCTKHTVTSKYLKLMWVLLYSKEEGTPPPGGWWKSHGLGTRTSETPFNFTCDLLTSINFSSTPVFSLFYLMHFFIEAVNSWCLPVFDLPRWATFLFCSLPYLIFKPKI